MVVFLLCNEINQKFPSFYLKLNKKPLKIIIFYDKQLFLYRAISVDLNLCENEIYYFSYCFIIVLLRKLLDFISHFCLWNFLSKNH